MNMELFRDLPSGANRRMASNRAQLRIRFSIALIAIDIACIVGSLFAASFIYKPGLSDQQWIVMASLLAPMYFGFALNSGAYASSIIAKPSLGAIRAVRCFILAATTVVLVAFYLKASADFSRGMVAIGCVFSIAGLALFRWQFLRRAHAIVGGNPYCVALIRDGDQSVDHADYSFSIQAGTSINPDEDCPIMFDRLATALRDADRVVVACPPERRLSWVNMLKGANIRSEIIATELTQIAPLALGEYAGRPTMVVAEGPLRPIDAVVKRMFDIVVSGLALIVLLPLMLFAAAAIKLNSPGPVMFVQTRIGQGNRLFQMLKFRSMTVELGDDAGHRSASRTDNRITSVGKFIRSTSIDELPQLINVLRGDMSIVGPRPHALGSRADDKLFWEVDGRYWHRHAAKPGLTGLAQVRGFRGATERESDLTDRLHADLEYLHNWSLWGDFVIIFQTFRVLVHPNAY
jgi:exopolysaccharide biosynthesis polyprenyl glycosylphosphotransferase